MRIFEAYCKWNDKIYAYDQNANGIYFFMNGEWDVVRFLPPEIIGEIFDDIRIWGNTLYLFSRRGSLIVQCSLQESAYKIIDISAMPADIDGIRFSNLVYGEQSNKLILVPFRSKYVGIYDLQEDRWDAAQDFLGLNDSNDSVNEEKTIKVRGYGADLLEGKLYMILPADPYDVIGIYDMKSGALDRIKVGEMSRLFHLHLYENRLYVQGITENQMYLLELNLKAECMRQVKLKTSWNGRHKQWIQNGIFYIMEKKSILMISSAFEIEEMSFEEMGFRDIFYINNGFVMSPQKGVGYFGCNASLEFNLNSRLSFKKLETSSEYLTRIREYIIAHNNILVEVSDGISLETYIKALPLSKENINDKNAQCASGAVFWQMITAK